MKMQLVIMMLGFICSVISTWAKNGDADEIHVKVGIGGKMYERTLASVSSFTLFSELPVDVTRNPVVQLLVEGDCDMWRAHLCLHGEAMKEVYQSPRPCATTLNLYGLMGWRGPSSVDVMLQFKDDINVVQFDLSAIAEKDVVLEKSKEARADGFGGNPASPQCFVETGRKQKGYEAIGLPENRLIPSTDPELGEYFLLPYDGPNVVELASSANALGETCYIDVPNQCYSKLGIVTASSGGDTSFTITLIYDDGSQADYWFESDDWYRKSRSTNLKLLEGMDWGKSSDGSIEKVAHFQLYEFILADIDEERKLDKIAIGNNPYRWPDSEERSGGIFAINGRTILFQ